MADEALVRERRSKTARRARLRRLVLVQARTPRPEPPTAALLLNFLATLWTWPAEGHPRPSRSAVRALIRGDSRAVESAVDPDAPGINCRTRLPLRLSRLTAGQPLMSPTLCAYGRSQWTTHGTWSTGRATPLDNR